MEKANEILHCKRQGDARVKTRYVIEEGVGNTLSLPGGLDGF